MGNDGSAGALADIHDDALREEIRRIAAAADCVLDEGSAPQSWAKASIVMIDTTAAQQCVRRQLPRRPGVIVVSANEPGLAEWQLAATLGAEQVLALPSQEAALVAVLGARPEPRSGDGVVIAVVGGRAARVHRPSLPRPRSQLPQLRFARACCSSTATDSAAVSTCWSVPKTCQVCAGRN